MEETEARSIIEAEHLRPVTWFSEEYKPNSIGIAITPEGWTTFYVGERQSIETRSVRTFPTMSAALGDLIERLRLEKRGRQLDREMGI